MRTATYDELNELCRGITRSFVHLETRDSYGTEIESPHMAKWRRGERDDLSSLNLSVTTSAGRWDTQSCWWAQGRVSATPRVEA
jgi:hypothetical protein